VRGRLKVFFDGGCRPNPGRMELAVVAAGRTTIVPDAGHGNSADAEWLALIEALTVARSLGVDDFVLLGDSADVVAKANGAARRRGDALRHLDRFRSLADGPIRVRHVGRAQNLAGIALARRHPR
jgi:ribonuclease HI